MTEYIPRPFLASPLASSRTSQPTLQSTYSSLRLLAAGQTSQREIAHSLFFTDSISHISSSPVSTIRRTHPIYGPLVSGKSFFHHSSFLVNHRILRETNCIFSTPAFNFSILIPVLMTAFQLLLWLQRLYSFSTLQLFPSSCDLQHKGSFRLKLLIKLPNWKLTISSSTHLFFF